jgi:ABC-type transport system substrate-binding protein
MHRHVVPVVCLVWALAGAACSGDDAASSTTAGGLATTVAPDSASTVPVTVASTTTTTTTTTTGAPVLKPYGGVARIYDPMWGMGSRPDIDPLSDLTINPATQVGLYRFSYTSCAAGGAATWCVEMVPDVVTEFPSFENGGLVENPDGTVTVRLEIHPDAVWEDGVPISGDDFAFTYRLHSNPDVLYTELYQWVDPDSLVVGPKSMQFTLTTVRVGWERLFRVIVPKHDVEGTDISTDWEDRMWVSGGPFRFDSVGEDYWVLTRNPNYWRTDPVTGQQLPYLDRIEVGRFRRDFEGAVAAAAPEELSGAVDRFFDDDLEGIADEELVAIWRLLQQAHVDSLLAGELDSVYVEQVPVDEIAEMVNPLLDAGRFEGGLLDSNLWGMLALNMGPGRFGVNDDSWNHHLAFRRAVAHALDRDRVASAAWGVPWQRLDSYVEMFSSSLSAGGWDRYDHDPDRARELLAGLCDELGRDCGTDPPRLVLFPFQWMQHRVDAAAEITTQLEAVGIEAETLRGAEYSFACGDYDTALLALGGTPTLWDFIELHKWWDPAGAPDPTPEGGFNFSRWGTGAVEGLDDVPDPDGFDESCMNMGPSAVVDEHTERMAAILEQMRTTLDVGQLRSLIAEAEEIAADQVVFIPLYTWPQWHLWSTDLAGFEMHHAGESATLWNAELWYRTGL